MFGIGPTEMLIIGIIAVILFGNRLPEVGRSLGKSLVEFKKGINGIGDEVRQAKSTVQNTATAAFNDIDDRDEATAPKFEPPKASAGQN